MGVAVASVEGQVGVGVSGEEDGAEVDLEGDGLHPAVDADVPLSWAKRGKRSFAFCDSLLRLPCPCRGLASLPGNRLWKLPSQLYPLN